MPVYSYQCGDQHFDVSAINNGYAHSFLATHLDVDYFDITLEHFTIPVIVMAINASGEPELIRCDIKVTQNEYDDGDHYERAMSQVEEDGYDVKAAFDYFDPAYQSMVEYRDECHVTEIVNNG